jgi:threonylcarbamoyladenosine tRNA methylthiotransferase MtaB
VGDYGKGEFGNKRHEHTFLELVQALDAHVDVARMRISSIEPNLLRDEIISFTAISTKFVPHFHIPLQSGSDAVLKKMKRRYMTDLYIKRVHAIKSADADSCIGVDVIVGFPGETEAYFLDTYNLLNNLPISYLHVFTYSERPNTNAASMDGVVPITERKRRNKMLRILSEKKKRSFYESQIGKNKTILFENDNREGYMLGYTDNYVRVKTFWNPQWANKTISAKLSEIDHSGLMTLELPDSVENATDFSNL